MKGNSLLLASSSNLTADSPTQRQIYTSSLEVFATLIKQITILMKTGRYSEVLEADSLHIRIVC